MPARIYTRTGDAGGTGLLGGTRVPKNDPRIEAIGAVDELNAFTGWLGDQLASTDAAGLLRRVQETLFTLGARLALDPEKKISLPLPELSAADVAMLEHEIDGMEAQLPPMKHFILPGGHPAVSAAHICRAVCRRAERACVALARDGSAPDAHLLAYLNRLSDYFFVLARYTGERLGIAEIPWNAGGGSL